MAVRESNQQMAHYFDRPHLRVPDGPIGGAAAWVGDQLTEHDWLVRLSDEQVSSVAAAVAQARASVPSMMELTAGSFPLGALADEVADWRRRLVDGLGFLLVRGLPVDLWSREDIEWAFWGLGQHLGEPGAQNPARDLLGRVTDYHDPHGSDQREYRSAGSIDFHCDAADVVGLCCLATAAEGGASQLVSSVTVFDRLIVADRSAAEALFEDFTLDLRQGPGVVPAWLRVQPCCYDGETLRTFMHLGYFGSADRHADVDMPDHHRRVLEAWSQEANRSGVALSMDLRAGDIQWVSNHSVVHARSGYVDDPSTPRELLRLWLSIDAGD